MGRKLFFAQQDNIAKEKRRRRLEKSGYIFGAHADEDAIRDKDKRLPKTKRMYLQHAELWKDFLEENGIRGYRNGADSKAPDHQLIKEFIRWYIHSTRGRLSKNGRPVMKSVVSCAERLFGGLEEKLQISVAPGDRTEIYSDIDLVLFPSSTAPWEVVWRVNQKWLKNNRDPNYTVFGIGIHDTKRPQFASGYILLALALEHGALFQVNTVDDLAQFDLSNGPIALRWNDEYLEKPVLRNVTAEGPQDIPLAKDLFGKCLKAIFTAAGYCKTPKIHEIRKNLGKKIEGKHGSALVSQIYGHKGPGTYPKDYLQHCSPIDAVSAILDEKDQSDHIEYFQGFEKFYEPGLPGELPANIEECILENSEILEIRSRIELLETQNADKKSITAEKANYRKTLLQHRILELKEYRDRWVREKRDQRILNRGKGEPMNSGNDINTRSQALVMPEVARIATVMSCTKELSFDEMLLFV
ncbi:hypothetical protein VN97_g12019 [Penicillium thymicola]|uniref:Uncharacterized protein n=1 Tax=Penicillium thymicola TaxID=293382 RepID=A0AAI9T630_PENTH|nr:hypothetical protein VN97_g12019 [Penicillium thymicola]